ncbi:hypothetical protein BUALT_Bualt14G0124600 [Buddleja alternifolia]|uniref:DELLA protein RGL1 n=1 Tax=Buddleja alternifolia TaxID=168488 RepID=A0AAV6WPZ7_9LAMI|nr:hypothetical protein BUALT_Bualt14G0124600 [Buddleja alternifolia]
MEMAPHAAECDQNDELRLTISCKAKKAVACSLNLPFEILNKYGSQKRLRSGKRIEMKHFQMKRSNGPRSEIKGDNTSSSQVLSASCIVRMAKTELIQFKNRKTDDFSNLSNNLKLSLSLLDAAEKFSRQEYDEAEKLLNFVLLDSHADDHPITRVVAFFARDLRERIDSETGKLDLEREVAHVDMDKALIDLKDAIHTCEQKLPFNQIALFTGIQTILDSVGSAKRIHFIDIGQKLGSHWIVMMHALANRKDCPIEQLKITAVCTPKDDIEECGKLLSSFAESMNLPFIFKILHSEMYELEKDMFELEKDEALAVYLVFSLITLSASPKNVDSLIKGIKNLNPHIMVVNEIEVNINGSDFIDRFHESLFLCSAMFDHLEDYLERDNQCRKIMEKIYFQAIIKNSVMTDDEESFKQCCKIDFWREYFARFGIVETELSQSSMYQASMLIRESGCSSRFTLSMNEKCMLLGWNGTPLRSLSAWKFTA